MARTREDSPSTVDRARRREEKRREYEIIDRDQQLSENNGNVASRGGEKGREEESDTEECSNAEETPFLRLVLKGDREIFERIPGARP